jgi:hypothetical protein
MVKCPKGCKLTVLGSEVAWTPVYAKGIGVLEKASNIYVGDIGLTIEDTEDCIYLHPKFKVNPLLLSISQDFCFNLIITNTRAEIHVIPITKKDNFTKDLSSEKLSIVKFDKLTCGATDSIEIKVITMLPPFAGNLTADRSWTLGCSPTS